MKSLNLSYITRLDHLRFFAAILVIFYHFRGQIALSSENIGFLQALSSIDIFIKHWVQYGNTGVSLFLVLTGFLFCLISDSGHKKIKYSGFVYNRILRIFPMMVLLVFIVIAISRETSTPMDILRILTLQLNTGHPRSGWGAEYFPSGPMWTVAVEFQFYLLFPFLALFLSRYGVKYLLGVILLFILIKFSLFVLVKGVYWKLYHTIIGRFDQFVIGMLFAILYKKSFIQKINGKNHIAIALLIFSLVILTANLPQKSAISFTVEATCWGGVIIAYLSMDLFKKVWLDKLLARLGELSFSLYLLHAPIIITLDKVFGLKSPETLFEQFIALSWKIPVVIIISFLTFNVIEKPFMSLRVKYTS